MNHFTLYEILTYKFEQMRAHHPSFNLMDIDDNLFPSGMITINTEVRNSNNELKTIKEIVSESWMRGEKNHLMIEGEGGIGKTITLLSLPDIFAPHPVPAIYIPLHELKEETNTIEEYIKNQVLDSKEQYDLLRDIVNKPWEEGPNLLLLLDGFNEIPVELRATISEDIERWSDYPGIQIITSSRNDIHTYVALSSSFSKIELQPLSEKTVSEYLVNQEISVPDNPAVVKLITTPLLLTLYIKAETIRNYRLSPFASFKETKNAGLLIWNYLQSELWRFRTNREEAKASVLAMEFIAPYIAWTMQQHSEFVLDESTFLDRIEEAYILMKSHIDTPGQLPEHIKTTLQQSNGLPNCDYICDLLKEQLCLFIGNEGEYRLMYQQFREALAAMHLINSSYLSDSSLPKEWSSSIDYYIMQFVVDLISEDEANRLWEQNRNTKLAYDDATRNQLQLQGLLHHNDFSHLDFSGLDLSNINLYSFRTENSTTKLPNKSKRMNQTKFSEKNFIAEGHKDWVTGIAITNFGRHVISGSNDCTVRVWDMKTGELKRTLEGHKNWVKAVAVTPSDKFVVSGSNDCTIRIWELESGKLIRILKGHKHWVKSVAITPDGHYIVSGSFDCTIRIWDIATGQNIRTLEGHESGVNAIAITPDCKYVVSGSNDHTIRIWDMETGGLVRTLEGHEDWVTAVAVSPDAKYIVSGSWDCTIRIWDMKTGAQIGKLINGQEDWITTIAITPDGKYIVCGSSDCTIQIWDMENRELIKTQRQPVSVNAIAVTPNGEYVVSGSDDRVIYVWHWTSGLLARTLGHQISANAVAGAPNGKHVVCGSNDFAIRIWNLETGKLIKTLEGLKNRITTIAISPNGSHIVYGLDDHAIHIWNSVTGEIKMLDDHEDWTRTLVVTPNRKIIVGGASNNTIRIWSLDTSKLINTIEIPDNTVNAIAITPNEKFIIYGSSHGIIRLQNIESRELIWSLKGHENTIKTLAVTPDGKRVVSGSDNLTVRIWELKTGKLIKTIEGREHGVTAIAITPNGKYIVSGANDGTIRITDIETMKLKTLQILPLSLIGLDFSKAIFSTPELKEILRQNGAKV